MLGSTFTSGNLSSSEHIFKREAAYFTGPGLDSINSALCNDDNFKLISLGLVTCVLTFYLKDLSLALGQTDRIPIILAVWNPILALTLFTFIGVFQINEK